MNGLELCRKIREQSLIHKQRYIYVILLTGRDSQEDIIQGLSAGADDYMLKPFDPLELKVRLKNGERLIQVKEKKSTFIHVDEITGIWNPQKILDFLAEEIERGCRLKMPVGVVLIEIDQFPQLLENLEQNEIHSLLRRLASQFKDTMRKYDKIGIYTRNQFLGVFPNCRKDHISHIGERLRRVADQAAAVGRQHITSSVGCTSSDLFPNCKDSDLVESSKKALSAAKKKGGNTVSYADPGQN